MLRREQVIKILERARDIDKDCQMFGAEAHKYRLEPPVPESFVRGAEEKCGLTLPESYRRFITQVGDGGAGPDYGITPFREFWKWGCAQTHNIFAERDRENYRRHLIQPFLVRPMTPEEAACSVTGNPEHYAREPERYYIFELPGDEDDDSRWSTDGFLSLGTRGCQWDYGIALNGEHRGKVFTTDNEGGFLLEARYFEEFYRCWLDRLSDTKRFRQDLEQWTRHFKQR